MSNQRSPLLKVLFVLMSTICCGFLAMQMSPLFLPKNPGLAGGAMVLMYGVFGLGLGLILSLILMNRLGDKTFKISTIALSILGVAGLIWLSMKISESNKKMAAQRAESEEFYRTHKPTAMAQPLPDVSADEMIENYDFGLGMARPHFTNLTTLSFYNNPTQGNDVKVVDQVTFKNTPQGPEIATAPPYLVPHHLKMDYQIFYFLVKSQTKDHYQIEVNKTTGQTTWVNKCDVSFIPWSEFLLNVFSVEPLNRADNLVRIKPMSHASPIEVNQEHILQPVQIKDEWIQVEILDENMKSGGKGWLRWRSDKALLIDYSLLS